MPDALVASFQIFMVGLAIGLSGPCIVACGPPLVVYFTGRQEGPRRTMFSLGIFLLGKGVACAVLGALAGAGAAHLQAVLSPSLSGYIHGFVAVLIMFMGILVYFDRGISRWCKSLGGAGRMGRSSLFLFGVALGASPCPPLIAVMSEITLISSSAAQGLAYGLAFGLGNMLAGLLAIGSACGLLTWLPGKLLTGGRERLVIFRKVCGAGLVVLGIWLI